MALENQILDRLVAITNTLNAIQTNSKRTEEFPHLEPLDNDAKIRVSVEGVSFWIAVSEISSLINALGFDVINFGFDLADTTSGSVTTTQEIVDYINSIGFTVNTGNLIQLSIVVKKNDSFYVKKYNFKRNNITGNWGTGFENGEINESDLVETGEIFIGNVPSGGDDILFNLGDIGSDSIFDYLNARNTTLEPYRDLLDDGSSYYFSAIINGDSQIYKYVGSLPKTIGQGQAVLVFSDFDLINADSTPLLTTSNEVIKLTLDDIGAVDFEDNVVAKMRAYLISTGKQIVAGVMPVIELSDVEYNFEIEADWTANSVTDEASFVTFMDNAQDGSGVTVTDFILDGDWIRCNLSNSDADGLYLDSSNIKKVISIGEWTSLNYLGLELNQLTEFKPSIALPSSLTGFGLSDNSLTEFNPDIALPSSLTDLYLDYNQLTEFNPDIVLPSSLTELYLGYNQLTTTSYTNAETWATAQPAFTSNCYIHFSNNTDSITGTNLENILLTKNVTITA